MRTRNPSVLAVLAGLMVVAAPLAPALADRGRGSDDRQSDDRGGRGADDRRSDDRRDRTSDDDRSGGGSSSSGGSSSGGSQAQSGNARELRFISRMRDADGTVAKARYRERTRGNRALKQTFDVEIKFAQPGEQFVVRVDGRTVGTVTANSLGIGKLELRPTPDDANEQPIPSDFPRLRAGAVVTVGSMQGTLGAQ